MMLPGVELARKRRVHCHSGAESSPADPTAMRFPVLRPTAMDESALAARIRLEEKLRRLAGPPPAASAATATSSSSSFSPRWGQHVDNGRGTSRRRKASNKGAELKRTGSRTELCAVCLDDFQSKQRVMKLPCSHKYHSDCLLPWLASHSDCPCCRRLVPSMNGLS